MRFFRFLAVLLFLLGITSHSGVRFEFRYPQLTLVFEKKTQRESYSFSKTSSPSPVELSFSENINLSVTEAFAEGEDWDLFENHVSHLSSSSKPGDGGNIVMYAHNTKNLFGFLSKAQIGEEVVVKTSDGEKVAYKITEKKVVGRDRVEDVMPTNEETLTLYTCYGIFDESRLIVKATPLT